MVNYRDENHKFSACLALSCMTAYQFSNVVVGENELCEAGQSLLQVLTNPTEEQQKQRFHLGQELAMLEIHRETQ